MWSKEQGGTVNKVSGLGFIELPGASSLGFLLYL
jgi:hypothetical protein